MSTLFHGLSGFLFVATAWAIGGLAESIVEAIQEEGVSGLPVVLAALSGKFSESGRDFPLLLLVYSYIAHLFVPTVALVIGANQFHKELHEGHARLLFTRVSRNHWMVSRFVWAALLWAGVSLFGGGVGAIHVASVSAEVGLPLDNPALSVAHVAFGTFLAGLPLLSLATLLNVYLRSNLAILILGLICWFGLGALGQNLLGAEHLVPWSPFFFMAGDGIEFSQALASGAVLFLVFLVSAGVGLQRKELAN